MTRRSLLLAAAAPSNRVRIALMGVRGRGRNLTQAFASMPDVDIAYVCDPQDLIPDNIPGIGLLDDAIMIEMVCTDLSHDVEAYKDFCKYRENEIARRGVGGNDLSQETWMAARRTQLHERMRRRRSSLWAARLGRSPF